MQNIGFVHALREHQTSVNISLCFQQSAFEGKCAGGAVKIRFHVHIRRYRHITVRHGQRVGVLCCLKGACAYGISAKCIACGRVVSERERYTIVFSCVDRSVICKRCAVGRNAAYIIAFIICIFAAESDRYVVPCGDGAGGFALCGAESACIVAVSHGGGIAAVECSAGVVAGAGYHFRFAGIKLGRCVDSVADGNIGIFPAKNTAAVSGVAFADCEQLAAKYAALDSCRAV